MPAANQPFTLNDVHSADAPALKSMFDDMYRLASFKADGKRSRDLLAAGLGMKLRKPLLGIMPRFSLAAVTVAALSDMPGVRNQEGLLLGSYYPLVIRNSRKQVIGAVVLDKNSDPSFMNRGDDATRAEFSIWMLPRHRRGNVPQDIAVQVGWQAIALARSLGFKNLEAVTSPGNKAALALCERLGFTDTGIVKEAPAPLGQRKLLTLAL